MKPQRAEVVQPAEKGRKQAKKEERTETKEKAKVRKTGQKPRPVCGEILTEVAQSSFPADSSGDENKETSGQGEQGFVFLLEEGGGTELKRCEGQKRVKKSENSGGRRGKRGENRPRWHRRYRSLPSLLYRT
jgi:hypothetical protein